MKRSWLIPIAGVLTAACVPSDAQVPPSATNSATGFGAAYIAKLESVQTHGEWVTYAGPGGDSVKAYVAYPMGSSPAPAMIIIHEIFGLSDWIRTVADDFASKGFVAIAPDLLTRRGGTVSADSARKLIGGLQPDSITVDLNATAAYLKSLKAVKKDAIGAIGFCWGGGQSFRYATNNPDLKVAVVCYGPNPDSTTYAGITAKVFGAYGSEDNRISGAVPGVGKAMEAAGKSFRGTIYPGSRHGFLRSQGAGKAAADSATEKAQADQAWADIHAFVKANLK